MIDRITEIIFVNEAANRISDFLFSERDNQFLELKDYEISEMERHLDKLKQCLSKMYDSIKCG